MNIKSILKSLALATLLSGAVTASDYYGQQIALLEDGIIHFEQKNDADQQDISDWEANMITTGYVTPEGEAHNADLRRRIDAADQRISHRKGQIADNEREIQKLRDAQRKQLRSQSNSQGW